MTARHDNRPTTSPNPYDLARRIVATRFERQGSELFVEGVPISLLAEEYGTPLYVYSRQVLEDQLAALQNALPAGRFQVHYSVKANPAQEIIRFFLGNGCGLEVASAGELDQAIAAGCDPGQILFAGPGKTDAELIQAVEAGIAEVHVESPGEICRLGRIAAALGREQRISLRVNPGAEAQGGAMRMGGRPAAFGIDEEQLDQAIDLVLREPMLELCGIHLFLGTQILDADRLLLQYRSGVKLATRVAERIARPLHTIDFGGGLGIPVFPHEQPLDLTALKHGLTDLVDRISSIECVSAARLILEPGRFLTASCGIYVTRVQDVKHSRGKTFVILDGGMHHHLAASGNLGQTIKRNFPLAVLNRLDKPAVGPVEVVGPLCTPLDALGRSVDLPALTRGDLIGVFQSGAYARTSSPMDFLSHPHPPEVWVTRGEHRMIRRRSSSADLLAEQGMADRVTCSPDLTATGSPRH